VRYPPPLVGGDRGEGINRPLANYLIKYARKLRRNCTQAEAFLLRRLRARQLNGLKFRRQQPIGNFIVDFVSFEKRIVIEIDGGQHATARRKDDDRDKWFADKGFIIMRFWNYDVFENLDGVLAVIRQRCLTRPAPSPGPSRQGRGSSFKL
jgi:very-short-patch-repair endonuclease